MPSCHLPAKVLESEYLYTLSTSSTQNGSFDPTRPANRCIIPNTMDESGRRRWCLYLPGVCIHAVPVSPGRDEELHLQLPHLPSGFRFHHFELSSNPEYSSEVDEFLSDIHPAFRSLSPTPPSPLFGPSFQADLHSFSSTKQNYTAEAFIDFISPCPQKVSRWTRKFVFEPAMHSIAKLQKTAKLTYDEAFENTSTSVAASQMRNALNQLADTVKDPEEKKVRTESYEMRETSADNL